MVSPPNDDREYVEYHFWIYADNWRAWKRHVDDNTSLDTRLRELIDADADAGGTLLDGETNTHRETVGELIERLDERQAVIDEREAELDEKAERLDARQQQLDTLSEELATLGDELNELDDEETLNLLRLKLGRVHARANMAADALTGENPKTALPTLDKIIELTEPFARET